jgi:putative hydrolase of the HAD superfamily
MVVFNSVDVGGPVGYNSAVPLAIFDLDNTLIDRDSSFRSWITRFDAADAEWLIEADGDGFVAREAFLGAIRDRLGVHISRESYNAAIVEAVELDPAVPLALQRLRAAGWTLAICTNGSTRQQWAKLHKTGLHTLVDAVAVSEEAGAKKPARAIFETVAARCGMRLEPSGWMIGDCPDRDIAGARRAGLRTVWMTRGRTWPGGEPPTATASTVDEAVSTVDSAAAPRR